MLLKKVSFYFLSKMFQGDFTGKGEVTKAGTHLTEASQFRFSERCAEINIMIESEMKVIPLHTFKTAMVSQK